MLGADAEQEGLGWDVGQKGVCSVHQPCWENTGSRCLSAHGGPEGRSRWPVVNQMPGMEGGEHLFNSALIIHRHDKVIC